MKHETVMWRTLRPVLAAAKLDPVRVENPVHPGTPDVNLADGRWIELKCLRAWPARGSTKVRIPHFTPQQRVWLYRRWKYAPGTTHLLLEIREDRQWLLFDGDVAAKVVGRSTRSTHRLSARAVLDVRSIGDLPKILAEVQSPEKICTGALVHDLHTPCPVHDAWGAR